MHVEVVTNIVPEINDDDFQLEGIAHWIKENWGADPGMSPLYPHYNMTDVQESPESLEHAIDIGKKPAKFVYAGNMPGTKVKTPPVIPAERW